MEINGKIKTISNGNEVILPITSTKAVLDENGKSLDSFIEDVNKMKDITPFNIKGKVNSVDDLPLSSENGDLYFVGKDGSDDSDEYVWTEDGWEIIGNTEIDLSEIESKVKENSRTLGYAKGKNLIENVYAGALEGTGTISATTSFNLNVVKVEEGKTYVLSNTAFEKKNVVGFFTSYPNINSVSYNQSRTVSEADYFTVPVGNNIKYMTVRSAPDITNAQVEEGTVPTSYEPYKPSIDERINSLSSFSEQTLKGLSSPVANSLDCWGVDVNVLKNSFTSDGKYHKVITSVDMGTLDWHSSASCFLTFDLYGRIRRANGMKCDGYTVTTVKSANDMLDKSMHYRPVEEGGNNPGSIILKDESYNGDVTAFKNAMKGVILYYELVTPVDEVVKVATNEEISKINENVVTLGYSGKNLLNVDRNITLTKPDYVVAQAKIKLKAGNYILTFGISSLATDAEAVINFNTGSFNTPTLRVVMNNLYQKNAVDLYFDSDFDGYFTLYSGNTNSSSYTDLMLRPASITDDTYEPYKPSVDERLNQFAITTRYKNADFRTWAEQMSNGVHYGNFYENCTNVPNNYVIIEIVKLSNTNSTDTHIIATARPYTESGVIYTSYKYNHTWTNWYKFTGTTV